MSAGFTPGPWAVSKQKARRVTASGVVICNAVLRNRGGPKHKTELKDEHEAEANAALIAAAPDLYEALVAMEAEKADYMRINNLGDPASEHTNKMARAALAKARGENL